MKPFVANLVFAILLIAMSLWGYLSSDDPSFTALIPTFAGVILLAMTPSMKKENRIVAHIVVVLTLLLIIALIKPLTAAFARSDNMAIMRVLVMLGWGVLAMIVYVKSFIKSRRKKR
jgi:hypothetical protein